MTNTNSELVGKLRKALEGYDKPDRSSLLDVIMDIVEFVNDDEDLVFSSVHCFAPSSDDPFYFGNGPYAEIKIDECFGGVTMVFNAEYSD